MTFCKDFRCSKCDEIANKGDYRLWNYSEDIEVKICEDCLILMTIYGLNSVEDSLKIEV